MRLIRLLKKDLGKEISAWVDKKLISVDQARSICQLYGISYDEIHGGSYTYRALVVLGCFFIGLSLITLIGANWDEIPRELRTTGLILLTLGTHGFALKHYVRGRVSLAALLFGLGSLFYGASIILISQIYHLGEYMPDGLLWWALGSLPFGLVLKSPWLTLLTGLLALQWFFVEFFVGFFSMGLVVIFPLFIVFQIYVLVKARSSLSLFLTCTVSFLLWVNALLSILWRDERRGYLRLFEEHIFVEMALFVLLYVISQWLYSRSDSKLKDYGMTLWLFVLRFTLIGMLVFSYEEIWVELMKVHWNHRMSMCFIVVAVMAVAFGMAWKLGKWLSVLVPALLIGGVMVTVLLTESLISSRQFTIYATYLQIFDNIVLVLAGTGLIMRGNISGVSHYFFLGVAVILVTGYLRYMDLIGNYIGGATLFLLFAFVLLGAAKFWKTRQIQGRKS